MKRSYQSTDNDNGSYTTDVSSKKLRTNVSQSTDNNQLANRQTDKLQVITDRQKTIFLRVDELRSLLATANIELAELKDFEDWIPKIPVVGNQSSGKSSTLTRLTGIKLPAGEGMTTRFPIEIQMRHGSDRPATFKLVQNGVTIKQGDYHENVLNFFQKDAESNPNQKIFAEQLIITTYKPEHINFTFVDLPGLISQQTVDEQVAAEQIEKIVKKKISKPNSLILQVIDASTDPSGSLSARLVNEVEHNPNIFVFTKADARNMLGSGLTGNDGARKYSNQTVAFIVNKVVVPSPNPSINPMTNVTDSDRRKAVTWVAASDQQEQTVLAELMEDDTIRRSFSQAKLGRQELLAEIKQRYCDMINSNLPDMARTGKKALAEVRAVLKSIGEHPKNTALIYADWRQHVMTKFNKPQSVPYETRLRVAREQLPVIFGDQWPADISLDDVKLEMDQQRGNTSRLFMGCENVIKIYMCQVVNYFMTAYQVALDGYKQTYEAVLSDMMAGADISQLSLAGASKACQQFMDDVFAVSWIGFQQRMIDHLVRVATEPRVAHEDSMQLAVRNYQRSLLKELLQNVNHSNYQQLLVRKITERLELNPEAEEVEETCIKIKAYWSVASKELQTMITAECNEFESKMRLHVERFLTDDFRNFEAFAEKRGIAEQRQFYLAVEDQLSSLLQEIQMASQ